MPLIFQTSEIDPSYAGGGAGAAFQRFVFELIASDFPHLHPYGADGKDGGIDHLTDQPGQPRVAVECKFCGTDGVDAARKRWLVTKANLANNLTSADGPGQSQYRPWYRTAEPITRYIFATSARFENAARVDELRDEIRGFFRRLGEKHSHLAHLRGIAVEVYDWNYIEGRISPSLRFRWFPRERPAGLRLLVTEEQSATGFRAWLRNSMLPFYSRSQHLSVDPAPVGASVPDERQLLDLLTDSDTLGLILTGRGGVGKTRLSLELGRLAQSHGWQVWLVQDRFTVSTLDTLAVKLGPDLPALLVFDYVELHGELPTIAQHLEQLVDSVQSKIRYVATCRATYYGAISAINRHKRIELSALANARLESWLARYRSATVRHILYQAGFPVTEHHLRACRDVPVLAVFMHWLHKQGRDVLLSELLEADDFGRWVLKRVTLSFPESRLNRELAWLVALLPLDTRAEPRLSDGARSALTRLAIDGWVERTETIGRRREEWQAVHDVLADRVVIAWLDEFGGAALAREWISALLHEAIRLHSLPSAMRSLQRLAEHLPLSETEWRRAFEDEIRKAPSAWRHVSSLILRTSSLADDDKLYFLAGYPEIWRGSETSLQFHSALKNLLYHCIDKKRLITTTEKKALVQWIRRSLPYQGSARYLLSWALRFAPRTFRKQALDLIYRDVQAPQTSHLIHAWLEADLPSTQIASAVRRWCNANGQGEWFPLVFDTWLAHVNDTSFLRQYLIPWLTGKHGRSLRARFVLGGWLKVTKETELVRTHVDAWLSDHRLAPEASYVISTWLDAGADRSAIEQYIIPWLAQCVSYTADASWVLRSWIASGATVEAVQQPMLEWIRADQLTLQAQYVFSAWLRAGHSPKAVEEYVSLWLEKWKATLDASYVIEPWLRAGGNKDVVRPYLAPWLHQFGGIPAAAYIIASWLLTGGEPSAVPPLSELPAPSAITSAWTGTMLLCRLLQAEPLQSEVATWFSENLDTDLGCRLLEDWIRLASDLKPLEDTVKAWLTLNHGRFRISFITKAWLDAGGSPDFVRDALLGWLQAKPNADRKVLLSLWIAAGGDQTVVEKYLPS